MLKALFILNISQNLAEEQYYIRNISTETGSQCPKECQCYDFQVSCPALTDDILNIPADTKYM